MTEVTDLRVMLLEASGLAAELDVEWRRRATGGRWAMELDPEQAAELSRAERRVDHLSEELAEAEARVDRLNTVRDTPSLAAVRNRINEVSAQFAVPVAEAEEEGEELDAELQSGEIGEAEHKTQVDELRISAAQVLRELSTLESGTATEADIEEEIAAARRERASAPHEAKASAAGPEANR